MEKHERLSAFREVEHPPTATICCKVGMFCCIEKIYYAKYYLISFYFHNFAYKPPTCIHGWQVSFHGIIYTVREWK